MKYLLLLLLLPGCVSGNITITEDTCSFEYKSVLKDVASPNMELCGATFTSGTSKSSELLKDVLVKALTP